MEGSTSATWWPTGWAQCAAAAAAVSTQLSCPVLGRGAALRYDMAVGAVSMMQGFRLLKLGQRMWRSHSASGALWQEKECRLTPIPVYVFCQANDKSRSGLRRNLVLAEGRTWPYMYQSKARAVTL